MQRSGSGSPAFETAGYAFTALLTLHGLSLHALVQTELPRSVLAPFGHGLWTAILGGVLFREARDGRLRYTWPLLGTYLWVSVLHALWDSVPRIATLLTYLLTGSVWELRLLSYGYVVWSIPAQVDLYMVLSDGGLAVVAALGIATLLTLWRRSGHQTYQP